jgi:hypothetical protein
VIKNYLKCCRGAVVATVVKTTRMSSGVSSLIQWRRLSWRRRTMLAFMASLLGAGAWIPCQAAPNNSYEIKTETDMPNLKENLRYADTQVWQCIDGNTVSDFFPILQYEALHSCFLEAGNRLGDTVYYPLVCNGSSGTTGAVLLYTHADRVEGLLAVKMGGKNMRFSQRIHATRQGGCQSPQ